MTPGTTDANRGVALRLWQGIATADVATLSAVLDEKTIWRMYGRSPFAGAHTGVDGVFRMMAAVGELADELESTLLDIFASEHGAVIRYAVEAQRGERHLESEHLFWIGIEEGRVTTAAFGILDQDAYDRFWLDEARADTPGGSAGPETH